MPPSIMTCSCSHALGRVQLEAHVASVRLRSEFNFVHNPKLLISLLPMSSIVDWWSHNMFLSVPLV